MNEFKSVHEANAALPRLGIGEVVSVAMRPMRVVDIYGKTLISNQDDGTAGIGYIPGDRWFYKTSGNGRSTSDA